mmetsp:Transcript_51001/g.95398  ORF Transcript_51001/g.95398 Transcript_51001/m.95398 type:complete len:243 (-) Transcript_51001:39-767(-)
MPSAPAIVLLMLFVISHSLAASTEVMTRLSIMLQNPDGGGGNEHVNNPEEEKPGPSEDAEHDYNEYRDRSSVGDDIQEETSATVDDCIKSCNEAQECIGFVWLPNDFKCTLKNFITLSRGQVFNVTTFAKMKWMHDPCKFIDARITSQPDKGDTPVGRPCDDINGYPIEDGGGHGESHSDDANGESHGDDANGESHGESHGDLLLQAHQSSQTRQLGLHSPLHAALMRSDRSIDGQSPLRDV